MSSIETLVQQTSSILSTAHSVGQTYLSLQSVSGFVAPGRVEVSTGVTKKVTIGYFSFTGVDSGLKRLTGISGTSGTVDVGIPAGAKVEQVFLDFAAGTGPQGPQGSQGYQGANGAQGSNGANGVQGPQGSNGSNGAQGPQGFQGNAGSNGAQGAAGSAGVQGPQGFQGTAGSNGAQGPQGNQGANGSAGSQGAQGAQGNQGFQGTAGSAGSQGAQGAQGNQGAQGSGVAAGSDTQIQYNSSGAFAGTSGLNWRSGTKTLQLSGTTAYGFQSDVDPNTDSARGFTATVSTASAVQQIGFAHLSLLPAGGASSTVAGFASVIAPSSGNPTSYCFNATNYSSNGYGVQSTGRGYFQAFTTSHDTLTLQAQTSQTGKLLSCKNSSGTTTTTIGTDGTINVGSSAYLQVRNTQTNYAAEIWGPFGGPVLRVGNAANDTYPNSSWRIYGADGNGRARLEAGGTGTLVWANNFLLENNYSEYQSYWKRVVGASSGSLIGWQNKSLFDSSATGTVACTAMSLELTDNSPSTGKKLLLDMKVGGSSKFQIDTAGRVTIAALSTSPSDTPAAGTMLFCTSDNRIYIFNGTAWRVIETTAVSPP